MGINVFRSSSMYDDKPPKHLLRQPKSKSIMHPSNPDPFNFIIGNSYSIGHYLLVEITYPDCNNYEGRKYLVYKDITIDQLAHQKSVDPHFSENKKFPSPVARFEPTRRGWDMATVLLTQLQLIDSVKI